MGVQKTTKAEANDGFFDFKPVVICYERISRDKYNLIERLYIPYIDFEFTFNCFPKTIVASKNNAAKAAHSTTNREEIRGPRTYISRGCESGYLAKKRKKAGACKAARKEQFLSKASKLSNRPSIILSRPAIQRYRERGLNAFPMIKCGDANASSATVVTFLPKRNPSLKQLKTTRDDLLPVMQHGGYNKSKDLLTRKGKAPKQIESIFVYSKNAIKKIDVERRRRRRKRAYKRTGYYAAQMFHFRQPNDRLSKKAAYENQE